MSLIDLIVGPIVFLLLFLVVRLYANRIYPPNSLEHRYFSLSFVLKCLGAVALGMIYQFYYGGGDTFNYYDNARNLYVALINEPLVGLELLLGPSGELTQENYYYAVHMYFFSDSASYFVVRVTAFFSLLTFESYVGICLFFAFLSFTGVWMIYSVFIKEYPYLKKKLAWACLFLPSMIFWGSGLMKDSLCIAGIGWLFYGIYHLVIKGDKKIKSIILIFLGGFLLYSVKLYILLSILPAIMIWVSVVFNKRFSSAVRIISLPIVLLLMLGVGYLMISNLSSESEKYSLENIQETSKVTSYYLRRISDEGASYTLSSTFDGSLTSAARLAPEAILASFFRPFLWESRNVVMLMSGVENTIFLILFLRGLYLLIMTRNYKIQNNKLLVFGLIFSLTFALGIGLTTFNFGALVRYKLPFLPFLIAALVVWNYKDGSIRALTRKKKIRELRSKILARKLT